MCNYPVFLGLFCDHFEYVCVCSFIETIDRCRGKIANTRVKSEHSYCGNKGFKSHFVSLFTICLTFNNVLIDMGNEVNCHFCVNSTVEDFQALINIKSMSDNDTSMMY